MITSPHSKSKVYRDIIKSRSILSQMGYLKINYGDFQGLKPSPQHVYKQKIANCTGFGTFLVKFKQLRAKSDQFDNMKQLLW